MSLFPHPGSRARVLAALALVAATPHAGAQGKDWNVVLSQRLWFANWDQRLVDVRVVAPPTATTPAIVNDGWINTSSNKTVPITSLAVRKGPFLATVSKFHGTSFDSNGLTTSGRSERDEVDVSLGYQAVPGLLVSYIRKTGNISEIDTVDTAAQFGGPSTVRGTANLLGLSGSAGITDRLSLYGNAAAGPGRWAYKEPDGRVTSVKARYVVGEFGLAYRLASGLMGGSLDAVTLQAGLRTQSIHVPAVVTAESTPEIVVVNRQTKGRTTTEGLVLSVGLVF
ncbi:MAG: hypothetical protein JNN18_12000 [Rubrivivax sp.]|nr:hypothetical protein [Rubrivivax sp.]